MGPWSRSFIAAVGGRAERPDLEVTNLRVTPGTITADVEDCEVTLSAGVIPSRIWAAIGRYASNIEQLAQAVDGRVQSVHLEHLLEEDWEELLVPRRNTIMQ